MERYVSPVTSGVNGYECSMNSIKVCFSKGAIYFYTVKSCDESHVSEMKRLAEAKKGGLNTYMNKNRPGYARKERSRCEECGIKMRCKSFAGK
jgi:hypothetical protein